MKKIHDEAWTKEMLDSMPPMGYRMTLSEGCALMSMNDRLHAIAAAYNYGFQRGQNFMRNTTRTSKPAKKQGSE